MINGPAIRVNFEEDSMASSASPAAGGAPVATTQNDVPLTRQREVAELAAPDKWHFTPQKYSVVTDGVTGNPDARLLLAAVNGYQAIPNTYMRDYWRLARDAADEASHPAISFPKGTYLVHDETKPEDIVKALAQGVRKLDCDAVPFVHMCLPGYPKVLSVAVVPVTVRPLMPPVQTSDRDNVFTVPVYVAEVEEDGKIKPVIVTHDNKSYVSVRDWLDNLPAAEITYPKNLGIAAPPNEQVQLVTTHTPEAVREDL
jgi:hypothetical protein